MYQVILVTGSRAEYGIMKNLIKQLRNSNDIELKLVVCAMHLEKKYGYTYKEIENDGFKIDLKVPMNIINTEDNTILKAMSILQTKLADYYKENKFDLTIILGDRYEMLSVVNASVINKVPICHLHGGEKTLGNYDEFIRHSITKMSHIHLVSTQEYKNRVLQLGEEPNKVYNIGSLGVENVLQTKFLDKKSLQEKLGCKTLSNYFVVLFHPVTLEGNVELQTKELLKALTVYKNKYNFIFIGGNSDSGSDKILDLINDFVIDNENSYLFKSLSTNVYHSLLKYSQGLIGNSSSGIIEVPSLNKYTLNIGNRQEGRVKGNSIVDVKPTCKEIEAGIDKLLNSNIINISNPYYQELASKNAYNIILKELKQGISIKKVFKDL
ncbi:MAG: UDP-N-acetylglucosamine 2-epimerase [Mycoplasmatales bacterium]